MIYRLSDLNQKTIERGVYTLFKEIKNSFRKEPSGTFLNCFLAFLCVILFFLSANHSVQSKRQGLTADIMHIDQPFKLKAEAAQTDVQTDKNIIIDKLAEEASKESPTEQSELKENIGNIVEALDEKQIATPRVIAYAMATAERETANTFKPIEEYGGPQQAIALGYSGGERYYGRGYIQITHDYNYATFGEKIGMGDQLVQNPELALHPEIASDILAEFFKENGVAEKAERDFVEARQPVNGYDHAEYIAYEAEKYLEKIEEANAEIAYK